MKTASCHAFIDSKSLNLLLKLASIAELIFLSRLKLNIYKVIIMVRMLCFLKISIILSVIFFLPGASWAMDPPIKKEPLDQDYMSYRELHPVITLARIREVLAGRDKVNPKKFTNNCVRCAIYGLHWLDMRTKNPKQDLQYRESSQNMACDDFFAELIDDNSNTILSSKMVRIDMEDGSKEPLRATFDAVVLEKEGNLKLLSDYLRTVPLKSVSPSSFYRAGLLYLINKTDTRTGHMINFYLVSDGKTIDYYTIDFQRNTAQKLEDFIKIQTKHFLNYAYIWYDKSELEIPIGCSSHLIKIEDHEVFEIKEVDTDALIAGVLANNESSQEEVIKLFSGSDRYAGIAIVARLIDEQPYWALEALKDKIALKDAIESLTKALMQNAKNAEAILEHLAKDSNPQYKELATAALSLAANNGSQLAKDIIKTFSVAKNKANSNDNNYLQKVASSALVYLINKNNPWAKEFTSIIATHNPKDIKTALITYVALIDSPWAQGEIEKFIASSNFDLHFSASLVLGSAAARGSQWAMDKILYYSINNNYIKLVSIALRRAADNNSTWAKKIIIEFAKSDALNLREIAVRALIGINATTPAIQEIILGFLASNDSRLKEVALMALKDLVEMQCPWATKLYLQLAIPVTNVATYPQQLEVPVQPINFMANPTLYYGQGAPNHYSYPAYWTHPNSQPFFAGSPR